MTDPTAPPTRLRRPPPPFRSVAVSAVEHRTPRLTRVTLRGSELEGFRIAEPASSVRVLLPPPGSTELEIPKWTGNEFRLSDGRRPTIRTLTPRRGDERALEVDIEIVRHGGGAASSWASAATVGSPAAISGPARGYSIDEAASAFVLAGDETALPAISQLLEALPDVPTRVVLEAATEEARIELRDHPSATVTWRISEPGQRPGETLVQAIRALDIAAGTKLWVAGEAAGVQQVRRYLFEERGLSRRDATVRGYWKHGRTADSGLDE